MKVKCSRRGITLSLGEAEILQQRVTISQLSGLNITTVRKFIIKGEGEKYSSRGQNILTGMLRHGTRERNNMSERWF